MTTATATQIDPTAKGLLQDALMRPPLRITYLPGTSSTLVISFAGAGRTDFEKPVNEFYKLAHGDGENHVLFIIDDSRSWMNGPQVARNICQCIQEVKEKAGITRVIALGNSMGGTMAIILSQLMHIDSVIALTPQVSVDPEVVPEETRWVKFRNNIETFHFRKIIELPSDRSQITIIHGDSPNELMHALKFPKDENAAHFIVPGGNHALAQTLHKSGDLKPIILYAIAGKRRRIRQWVKKVGGVSRLDYERSLATN